jgi:hypothetical protein
MEDNLISKTSVFLAPSCFTHLGLGIERNPENNFYQIYAILTQKLISVESAYTLKDGHVIIGQMLVPNCFIYGVQLVKNAHSNSMLGPSKISFNKDTNGFVIVISNKLHGAPSALSIRKVHFYVINTFCSTEIPYLDANFLDNNVQWNNLELALVQVISFTRLPEKKSESIELYLAPPINGININANVTKEKAGGVQVDIDWGNKSFSGQGQQNKPQGSSLSLLRHSHLNNKYGNINTVIPEEDSIIKSSAIGNSDNKSLRNFAQTLTNNLSEQRNNSSGSFISNNLVENRLQGTLNNNILNNMDNNNFGNNITRNDNIINHYPLSKPADDFNMNNIYNNNTLQHFGTANNNPIVNSNQLFNPKAPILNSNNNLQQNNNPLVSNLNANPINNLQNNHMSSNNNNNFMPNNSTPSGLNANLNLFQNNPSVQNHNLNNNIPQNQMLNQNYYDQGTLYNPNVMNTNNNLNLFNNNNNNNNQFNNNNPYPMQNNQVNNQNLYSNNPNQMCQAGYYNPSNPYNQTVTTQPLHNPHILNVQNIPNIPNTSTHNILYTNQISTNVPMVMAQSRDDFWKKLEGSKPNNNNISLKNFVSSDINKKTNEFIYNNYKHLLTATNKKGEVISRSAIKFREERLKQEGSNFNSLDSYIFKDALDKIEKNNSNKIMDEEKKLLNEKILDNIIKRYLTENDLRCNVNPAFEELYQTMSCYDTIITIKCDDVFAHKVVLISQSQVFKEMIQKRDNKLPNEINKIVLPDSYKIGVFKDVLKWIYTGKVSSNMDIFHYREMLIIADNLRIYTLQKILIVKFILPNMTKESSIKFLKDSYSKQLAQDVRDVWNLLATFSLNCLSKNSSVLIKNNRNEFLGMELDLLFKCIEQSVFYLVEDIHLISLIKLIIDREYATDVFDLVTKLSKPYMTAKNYNFQSVDISELIIHLDPLKPIEIAYLSDETNENLIKLHQSTLNISENSKAKEDSIKNVELGKNKIEIIDMKKINSNNPSTNFVSNIDIKKNKQPTFTFSFTINQDHINSCSIFSEAFNTNSRSWLLKVDITDQGDISIYLVERGCPIIIDSNSNVSYPYQDKYALKFNSVLFEFEIKDISFEKTGIIFFSFVNGQNQIIGHENFFNIKQLGKKDYCLFNIWIKEYPLHAACLQHITDNFQLLSGYKKHESKDKAETEKNLYDLLPYDLGYILNSDYLKVDNENTVFTCVYKYSINKNSQDIDLLVNSIRYKFVDFKLLCTTARDHETIKNSNQFKKCFQRELDRRLKMPLKVTNELVKDNNINIIENDINKEINRIFDYRCHRERKCYIQGEKFKSLNISNDLASFFLENEHHSGYIKEIDKVIIPII